MAEKITMETLNTIASQHWILLETEPNSLQYKRYALDAIIDENKSIDWNREEVKRRNEEYDAEEARCLNEAKELFKKFENTLLQYIMQELKCTAKYAEEVKSTIFKIARTMAKAYDIDDCVCDEDVLSVICNTLGTDIIELLKKGSIK